MHQNVSLILVATVWFSFAAPTVAQQPTLAQLASEKPTVEKPSAYKQFQKIASGYQLRPNGQDTTTYKLLESPLLNWTNPQRKTEASALFIWTHANRPKAALCIYPFGTSHFQIEFQSLSTEPFVAQAGGGTVWEPRKPGITFRLAEAAPTPSDNASVRLRQMRMLAREYIATIQEKGHQPERLRLLPSPIYRYPAKGLDSSISDGAMFAFVVGTDPETLLLIESTKATTQAATWQVAFARMTVVPTEVHRNGEIVWESDSVSSNRYETYYVMKSLERDNAVIKTFD